MEDTEKPWLDDLIDELDGIVGKTFKIGKDLRDRNKEKLIHLLEAQLDVFACALKDLLGVDPSIITQIKYIPRFPYGEIEREANNAI